MIDVQENDILIPGMILTNGNYIYDKEILIPNISNEELLKRYNAIKPLVGFDDELYYMREFTEEELSGINYLWERANDKREKCSKEELTKLRSFLCLHKYAYHALFKPSINEVLSQFPEELLEANYFQISQEPIGASSYAQFQEIFDAGYHVSKVRTFKKNNTK